MGGRGVGTGRFRRELGHNWEQEGEDGGVLGGFLEAGGGGSAHGLVCGRAVAVYLGDAAAVSLGWCCVFRLSADLDHHRDYRSPTHRYLSLSLSLSLSGARVGT